MIPAPVPDLEVLDQTERFIDALNWGEIADAIFAVRQQELGLPDPRRGTADAPGDSILMMIAIASHKGARQ